MPRTLLGVGQFPAGIPGITTALLFLIRDLSATSCAQLIAGIKFFPVSPSLFMSQISLLSRSTGVWGKEISLKKLLVKKEKFDFSRLFSLRGAVCCSCLCYPQEGTFLKANWNSAPTQPRPEISLIDLISLISLIDLISLKGGFDRKIVL